ncbi:MAG: 16S rRNA (cytidine(1402)-2'-O)-methyltransferase, partial [Ruminococcus sp.]|nr:16S rRNA (cytidine(1402)-2'-O)-methyltransferase [Ruminococcus sp.]
MDEKKIGKLYIVATPIGNSRDMSPRGRDILSSVDIIAAEDTRRSMVLLGKLEIRNKLVSNHKFNEYGKARYFVDEMLAGKSIAVITDAGTPCISDPGNELIRAAVEAGIDVIGVPGCCAAVTALSVSGFDLSSFLFYGFFPRENAERRKLLEKLRRGDTRTFVFYESPKRIMELVDFFVASEAGVRMCLCNDLTKLHETAFRDTPREVKEQLLAKGNYDKGEYAVVIEIDEDYIFNKTEHTVSAEAMLVDAMVAGELSAKEAVAAVLSDENNSYSKNELKAAAL